MVPLFGAPFGGNHYLEPESYYLERESHYSEPGVGGFPEIVDFWWISTTLEGITSCLLESPDPLFDSYNADPTRKWCQEGSRNGLFWAEVQYQEGSDPNRQTIESEKLRFFSKKWIFGIDPESWAVTDSLPTFGPQGSPTHLRSRKIGYIYSDVFFTNPK